MNYTIDITQSFENDVSAVIDYIAHKLYNLSAAERLLNKAENTISQIGDDPLIFPLYHDEEIAKKGYHYAIISKYLIFYTIDESNKIVHLSRFLYGGQNVTDIL